MVLEVTAAPEICRFDRQGVKSDRVKILLSHSLP